MSDDNKKDAGIKAGLDARKNGGDAAAVKKAIVDSTGGSKKVRNAVRDMNVNGKSAQDVLNVAFKALNESNGKNGDKKDKDERKVVIPSWDERGKDKYMLFYKHSYTINAPKLIKLKGALASMTSDDVNTLREAHRIVVDAREAMKMDFLSFMEDVNTAIGAEFKLQLIENALTNPTDPIPLSSGDPLLKARRTVIQYDHFPPMEKESLGNDLFCHPMILYMLRSAKGLWNNNLRLTDILESSDRLYKFVDQVWDNLNPRINDTLRLSSAIAWKLGKVVNRDALDISLLLPDFDAGTTTLERDPCNNFEHMWDQMIQFLSKLRDPTPPMLEELRTVYKDTVPPEVKKSEAKYALVATSKASLLRRAYDADQQLIAYAVEKEGAQSSSSYGYARRGPNGAWARLKPGDRVESVSELDPAIRALAATDHEEDMQQDQDGFLRKTVDEIEAATTVGASKAGVDERTALVAGLKAIPHSLDSVVEGSNTLMTTVTKAINEIDKDYTSNMENLRSRIARSLLRDNGTAKPMVMSLHQSIQNDAKEILAAATRASLQCDFAVKLTELAGRITESRASIAECIGSIFMVYVKVCLVNIVNAGIMPPELADIVNFIQEAILPDNLKGVDAFNLYSGSVQSVFMKQLAVPHMQLGQFPPTGVTFNEACFFYAKQCVIAQLSHFTEFKPYVFEYYANVVSTIINEVNSFCFVNETELRGVDVMQQYIQNDIDNIRTKLEKMKAHAGNVKTYGSILVDEMIRYEIQYILDATVADEFMAEVHKIFSHDPSINKYPDVPRVDFIEAKLVHTGVPGAKAINVAPKVQKVLLMWKNIGVQIANDITMNFLNAVQVGTWDELNSPPLHITGNGSIPLMYTIILLQSQVNTISDENGINERVFDNMRERMETPWQESTNHNQNIVHYSLSLNNSDKAKMTTSVQAFGKIVKNLKMAQRAFIDYDAARKRYMQRTFLSAAFQPILQNQHEFAQTKDSILKLLTPQLLNDITRDNNVVDLRPPSPVGETLETIKGFLQYVNNIHELLKYVKSLLVELNSSNTFYLLYDLTVDSTPAPVAGGAGVGSVAVRTNALSDQTPSCGLAAYLLILRRFEGSLFPSIADVADPTGPELTRMTNILQRSPGFTPATLQEGAIAVQRTLVKLHPSRSLPQGATLTLGVNHPLRQFIQACNSDIVKGLFEWVNRKGAHPPTLIAWTDVQATKNGPVLDYTTPAPALRKDGGATGTPVAIEDHPYLPLSLASWPADGFNTINDFLQAALLAPSTATDNITFPAGGTQLRIYNLETSTLMPIQKDEKQEAPYRFRNVQMHKDSVGVLIEVQNSQLSVRNTFDKAGIPCWLSNMRIANSTELLQMFKCEAFITQPAGDKDGKRVAYCFDANPARGNKVMWTRYPSDGPVTEMQPGPLPAGEVIRTILLKKDGDALAPVEGMVKMVERGNTATTCGDTVKDAVIRGIYARDSDTFVKVAPKSGSQVIMNMNACSYGVMKQLNPVNIYNSLPTAGIAQQARLLAEGRQLATQLQELMQRLNRGE
jgi:hypothetical protein